MLRTKVREEIFKIVFCAAFYDKAEMAGQIDYAMEGLEGKSEENREYIRHKVEGILENIDTINQYISDNCQG